MWHGWFGCGASFRDVASTGKLVDSFFFHVRENESLGFKGLSKAQTLAGAQVAFPTPYAHVRPRDRRGLRVRKMIAKKTNPVAVAVRPWRAVGFWGKCHA